MGVLRLILAITVILAHAGSIFGYSGLGGLVAVQTFFIISGFYMSLILNEKYIGTNNYKLFISNRFLKLYPVYWTVAILAILVNLALAMLNRNSFFFTNFTDSNMSPLSFIYLIFTNIFMFGQDSVMFLQLNQQGMLEFCKNFLNSNPKLYTFLLVPQAWSLGVELLFYLIAPVIVRKRTSIITIFIALSLALRIFIYYNGLYNDPWVYRFFPTEVALFLFGAISYKIYANLKNSRECLKKYSKWACFIAIIITLLYQYIDLLFSEISFGHEMFKWIYYIVIMLSIPFIFSYTKRSELDRYLAELSYPIYISHMLVLQLTNIIISRFINGRITYLLPILSIIFTLLFSIVLVRFIIKPMEKLRQRRINTNNKIEINI